MGTTKMPQWFSYLIIFKWKIALLFHDESTLGWSRMGN
jgi:hypothetical protein